MTALALLLAQVPQGCVPVNGPGSGVSCAREVTVRTGATHIPWVIPVLCFALWATISILAARDMERRGQSGVVWFVVVFFAGIIGLVLWLVMRTNYEVQPERPAPPSSPYRGNVPLGDSPWSGPAGSTDQW